jgi:manganese transport protein
VHQLARLPRSAPRTVTVERLRSRGRLRGALPVLGPAFVAAIAYVDPGNFATNFSAGSAFGYQLLWVIVAANLVAMLVQDQSAKLGLATGRNLAQLCRERCSRPVTWALWAQAELVSIATDLAEVIGGAVALNLLFGIPLLYGGLITGAVAFLLLAVQSRGYRRFELTVAGLFGVILLGLLFTLVQAGPVASEAASGLVPHLAGSDALLLAIGILGATVMPHVIYLHSALTQSRIPARTTGERRHLLRLQRVDIVAAMGLAGVVNASMLGIAASMRGSEEQGAHAGEATLSGVHAALGSSLGSTAALLFALALLAAGFASSGVGTMAGQVVMAGFLRRHVPQVVRRAVSLAPAIGVLAVGVEPSSALVLSQVVLSFGIPFALLPLLLLTRRADVMGALVNRRATTAATAAVATLVTGLNAWLIVEMVS